MSLKIANFRGTGFVSTGVKFFTNSIYSHSAVLFRRPMYVYAGDKEYFITTDAVIEAWSGGVKLAPSLSANHPGGIVVDLFETKLALTEQQERQIAKFLCQNIGKKYDYWNVARFVPVVRLLVSDPAPYSYDRTHVYCSELVLEAFAAADVNLYERCEFWTIPPRDISRSALLKPAGQFTTT